MPIFGNRLLRNGHLIIIKLVLIGHFMAGDKEGSS